MSISNSAFVSSIAMAKTYFSISLYSTLQFIRVDAISKAVALEPAQDLDDGMQDKAKVGKKAQHTAVLEHFESTFNAVMCPSARTLTGS